VLIQLDDDGRKFVVAYANRSNNKTKVKYISYEGECFVVVWVVSSFPCYFMVAHSFCTTIIHGFFN